MESSEVLIVGGGPAGSSCAWRLARHGVDCRLLDAQSFPRTKLCAGWITPEVVRDLEIEIPAYPHRFLSFDRLQVHLFGLNFKLNSLQHSIRRYEFDDWLLKRSGVPVTTHNVRELRNFIERLVIMVPQEVIQDGDLAPSLRTRPGAEPGLDWDGTLREAREYDGPILIHARTTKGKGYALAEKDPVFWHGPSPFKAETGEIAKKAAPPAKSAKGKTAPAAAAKAGLSLDPGQYKLTVSSQGFETAIHTNVGVSVDQTTSVNVTLRPGAMHTEVTVTAAPPLTA